VTVFADSSALVKLYADEDGAELVRSTRLFVVSAVARVEVPAAIWRKHRLGQLSAADAGVLTSAFEADWYDATGPFVAIAAVGDVLADAAALVGTHGLRAYDAVQLASAAAARAADPEVDTVLCFDTDLSEAAAREGFGLAA
jgi:predicted nucleic acid-binding protein